MPRLSPGHNPLHFERLTPILTKGSHGRDRHPFQIHMFVEAAVDLLRRQLLQDGNCPEQIALIKTIAGKLIGDPLR